jgi:hypothetical protein
MGTRKLSLGHLYPDIMMRRAGTRLGRVVLPPGKVSAAQLCLLLITSLRWTKPLIHNVMQLGEASKSSRRGQRGKVGVPPSYFDLKNPA